MRCSWSSVNFEYCESGANSFTERGRRFTRVIRCGAKTHRSIDFQEDGCYEFSNLVSFLVRSSSACSLSNRGFKESDIIFQRFVEIFDLFLKVQTLYS